MRELNLEVEIRDFVEQMIEWNSDESSADSYTYEDDGKAIQIKITPLPKEAGAIIGAHGLLVRAMHRLVSTMCRRRGRSVKIRVVAPRGENGSAQ
jgi:predicted RNA-binding protein YlqC (UPF0109 family)